MPAARHHQALRRVLGAIGYYHRGPMPDLTSICGSPRPAPGDNWPLPVHEAERLLLREPFELLSLEPTKHGVAGALKAEARFPRDGRRLRVKWKVAPRRRLDGWNNNPRREIACYAIQRLFLDPDDYVVPTTTLRAVPLDAYRRLDPGATATIPGGACVVGALALWLDHVVCPGVLFDDARFLVDSTYAHHLSNFNVLAYLVAHRDCRNGNILVADADDNRRVYAIDNGISFGSRIYNFLTTNWNTTRVPAIRRSVVARLREVDHAALSSLAVLAELATNGGGDLVPAPPGPLLDPHRGVRFARGRVQLGLTAREIEAVGRRMNRLLRHVHRGRLAIF
jgi:hypothetical protein